MNEDQFKELCKKLDKIAALVAVQGKDKDLQIKALTKAGFTSHEIGMFTGTAPGTVRRRRSAKKKVKSIGKAK